MSINSTISNISCYKPILLAVLWFMLFSIAWASTLVTYDPIRIHYKDLIFPQILITIVAPEADIPFRLHLYQVPEDYILPYGSVEPITCHVSDSPGIRCIKGQNEVQSPVDWICEGVIGRPDIGLTCNYNDPPQPAESYHYNITLQSESQSRYYSLVYFTSGSNLFYHAYEPSGDGQDMDLADPHQTDDQIHSIEIHVGAHMSLDFSMTFHGDDGTLLPNIVPIITHIDTGRTSLKSIDYTYGHSKLFHIDLTQFPALKLKVYYAFRDYSLHHRPLPSAFTHRWTLTGKSYSNHIDIPTLFTPSPYDSDGNHLFISQFQHIDWNLPLESIDHLFSLTISPKPDRSIQSTAFTVGDIFVLENIPKLFGLLALTCILSDVTDPQEAIILSQFTYDDHHRVYTTHSGSSFPSYSLSAELHKQHRGSVRLSCGVVVDPLKSDYNHNMHEKGSMTSQSITFNTVPIPNQLNYFHTPTLLVTHTAKYSNSTFVEHDIYYPFIHHSFHIPPIYPRLFMVNIQDNAMHTLTRIDITLLSSPSEPIDHALIKLQLITPNSSIGSVKLLCYRLVPGRISLDNENNQPNHNRNNYMGDLNPHVDYDAIYTNYDHIPVEITPQSDAMLYALKVPPISNDHNSDHNNNGNSENHSQPPPQHQHHQDTSTKSTPYGVSIQCMVMPTSTGQIPFTIHATTVPDPASGVDQFSFPSAATVSGVTNSSRSPVLFSSSWSLIGSFFSTLGSKHSPDASNLDLDGHPSMSSNMGNIDHTATTMGTNHITTTKFGQSHRYVSHYTFDLGMNVKQGDHVIINGNLLDVVDSITCQVQFHDMRVSSCYFPTPPSHRHLFGDRYFICPFYDRDDASNINSYISTDPLSPYIFTTVTTLSIQCDIDLTPFPEQHTISPDGQYSLVTFLSGDQSHKPFNLQYTTPTHDLFYFNPTTSSRSSVLTILPNPKWECTMLDPNHFPHWLSHLHYDQPTDCEQHMDDLLQMCVLSYLPRPCGEQCDLLSICKRGTDTVSDDECMSYGLPKPHPLIKVPMPCAHCGESSQVYGPQCDTPAQITQPMITNINTMPILQYISSSETHPNTPPQGHKTYHLRLTYAHTITLHWSYAGPPKLPMTIYFTATELDGYNYLTTLSASSLYYSFQFDHVPLLQAYHGPLSNVSFHIIMSNIEPEVPDAIAQWNSLFTFHIHILPRCYHQQSIVFPALGRCLSGGSCQVSGQCSCPDGYGGPLCERVITISDLGCPPARTRPTPTQMRSLSNPLHDTTTHQGTSIQPTSCDCIDRYFGDQCQHEQVCKSRSTGCVYGTLITHNGKADGCRCECHHAFISGVSCNKCELACENGGHVDSQCTSCICPYGYHGLLCSSHVIYHMITLDNLPHHIEQLIISSLSSSPPSSPLSSPSEQTHIDAQLVKMNMISFITADYQALFSSFFGYTTVSATLSIAPIRVSVDPDNVQVQFILRQDTNQPAIEIHIPLIIHDMEQPTLRSDAKSNGVDFGWHKIYRKRYTFEQYLLSQKVLPDVIRAIEIHIIDPTCLSIECVEKNTNTSSSIDTSFHSSQTLNLCSSASHLLSLLFIFTIVIL